MFPTVHNHREMANAMWAWRSDHLKTLARSHSHTHTSPMCLDTSNDIALTHRDSLGVSSNLSCDRIVLQLSPHPFSQIRLVRWTNLSFMFSPRGQSLKHSITTYPASYWFDLSHEANKNPAIWSSPCETEVQSPSYEHIQSCNMQCKYKYMKPSFPAGFPFQIWWLEEF